MPEPDEALIFEAFAAMARVSLAGDQRGQLSSLPPPVADAGFPVLVVPTPRAVRAASEKVVQTGVKSAKLSLAARIAAAPVLAWAKEQVSDIIIESHVLSMMRLGRDSADEAGRAALDRYFQEHEDAAVESFPRELLSPAER